MLTQEESLRGFATVVILVGFVGTCWTLDDSLGRMAMWILVLLGGALVAVPLWCRYLDRLDK